jgi:hypothetical protein
MRWDTTITLVAVATGVDDEGVPTKEETTREVFANRRRISLERWASTANAGFEPNAEFELHTVDYDGEQVVRFGGKEYMIRRASVEGDYTVLDLEVGRTIENG